jgi:hypothetical protein
MTNSKSEIKYRRNNAFLAGVDYAGDVVSDVARDRVLTAAEAADLDNEFQSNAPDLAGDNMDADMVYEGMLWVLQERQKKATLSR